MKICVLMKQVPDKNSSFSIKEDNKTIDNTNITWVTNESDNYALEEALKIKEAHNGEVVICTLGNTNAQQVLKDAMAKGADRSILISDEKFIDLDMLTIAKIFSEVIKDEQFDLILSGLQSDDQGNAQLGLLLVELLNMSHASLVMGTEFENTQTIKVKRELESGWFQWTELTLPASISIQSGINTPRYATLKGIMMVKNKKIDNITSQDININISDPLISLNKLTKPEKSKKTVFLDGNPDEIANQLIDIFKNDIKVIN